MCAWLCRVLLVCRFVVPTGADDFTARVRRALELLTAAPGCLGGAAGRAVDDPDRWVLTVRFASVDAYRRALSPFPVREHVVPLLSEALADEPATFETLVTATAGHVDDLPSLRADPLRGPSALVIFGSGLPLSVRGGHGEVCRDSAGHGAGRCARPGIRRGAR